MFILCDKIASRSEMLEISIKPSGMGAERKTWERAGKPSLANRCMDSGLRMEHELMDTRRPGNEIETSVCVSRHTAAGR